MIVIVLIMAAFAVDIGLLCMAKAELQYGDDPWAKQLAQAIIDAQTKEIAEMKDWLSKQPK